MNSKFETSIPDLIRIIQKDLEKSQVERESEGKPSLFKVKSVDIEVQFGVSKSFEAGGDISITILTLKGGGKYDKSTIHKMCIHLELNDEDSIDKLLGAYPREK